MIPPVFNVEVDDRALTLQFERLPMTLKTNLRATITKLTNELLAQVRAAEPVRTGYLRSQTRADVAEGPDFVRGRVRIAATGSARRVGAAFGALEYGAPGRRGRFEVRAYTRRSGIVGAYHRTARLRALRFLRGPAEAMRPRALAELEAAVAASIEQSGKP
jgi:hypothetical protein